MTTKQRLWDRDALVAFFGTRRWFRGHAGAIASVDVIDIIPIQWPGSDRQFAVALVTVAGESGTDTYQLFFDLAASEPTDALEDAEFRRGLVDAFRTGATFSNASHRWIIESEGKEPLVAPPGAEITLSSAEQSNSSVIVEQEAILKMFRRVEPGINPDVETTRFLTVDRHFANVPALLGTIRFEDEHGIVTSAGMLQELVPGATNAWQYALETSKPFLRGARRSDQRIPFAEDAFRLGELTRAMHEALASAPEGSPFHPSRATATDVESWASHTHDMVEGACRSLERAIKGGRLPDQHAQAAQTVCEHRPAYHADVTALSQAIGNDGGFKARTHGDYHLGQVLRSAASTFLIIDFEGEPLRALSERRDCVSPIRDVAGMVRSFSYAAAIGAAEGSKHGDKGVLSAIGDIQATRWHRTSRDSFLRGYFARHDQTPAFLPRSPMNSNRLLMLFKTEKVFYELQYELDHRPDWVWIPLRGIAQLYA